ncbi:MAG TPA: ABC transporter ATP-binding protein [Anaerolineales bacterium]|nr:ABC transporter ATP-binding protein [Anaerolineales bacterium]
MLHVENLDVLFGDVQVLKDVSLEVHPGELVAVIGGNGAGKTTLIRTISGLFRPKRGSVTFGGKRISGLDANRVVGHGIVQVPEGRLLFPDMTVRENLELGAFTIKDKRTVMAKMSEVHELLPLLKERDGQQAGTLSGGEQQMLAIGRALMASPKLIMFDEPSLGLAPKLVQNVFEIVVNINRNLGVAVLLVEQNVQHCCRIAHRAYVLENGHVVLSGTGQEMLNNEHVHRAYLGL